jgi:hypothetical protein
MAANMDLSDYLRNNWTLDTSTIVTGWIQAYNLPNQPVNYSTIQPGLNLGFLPA